jgi:RNA polymerase sigma-70 factor (ECF subfamily)
MALGDTSHPHLSALYSDHYGWLHGWLRRKLSCTYQAADLAQDTFVRILASRDALAGVREPRAYLTTVAKRLLIDLSRRQRIEQSYLAELTLAMDGMEGTPPPERLLVAVEALTQIDAALQGLAHKPRMAFLMHYLDGDTHAAIAAALGVSDRMVRKYLVEALVHCHAACDD